MLDTNISKLVFNDQSLHNELSKSIHLVVRHSFLVSLKIDTETILELSIKNMVADANRDR